MLQELRYNPLLQDLRYAWRTLGKSPGFTAVVVATLALGIGVNTTIFSVIEGVLLRPLPYQDPERIVVLWEVTDAGGETHVSEPNFRDWRAQTHSFETMALHTSAAFGGATTVLGGREATRARVTAVSTDFFSVFQVQWGPLPPVEEGRRAHNWRVVARLRPGVPLGAARTDVGRLAARLKQEYGGDTDAAGVRVTPLQEQLVGSMRRPLWLLLGAAGFVLLVVCTNLASTLLARGAGRQREFAIRESLGATRGRLIRQLLTEGALLTALGVAASLFLSNWLLRGLVAWAPGLPRLGDVRIDAPVLAFTAGVAVSAAVLFGLLPALRNARAGRRERGSAPHRTGPWSLLVAGEVSMAFVLLIGAGLLIRSFWKVLNQDPGFKNENVLAVGLAPPESKYPDEDKGKARGRYFQRVLDDLSALPGVTAVGLVNHPPLGGLSWSGDFEIEGRGPARGVADYRIASGGYFDALGIQVLRGHVFDERDRGPANDVAVIDRALAARYWPGEDPLGKRIRNLANDAWIYPGRWLSVIGVVEAVRHDALIAEPRPTVYVNFRQRPARLSSATVVLRGTVPPDVLVGPARAHLRAIDSDVPAEFTTMRHVVRNSVNNRRFTVLVLGGFAALALLLAALGIFGVVGYPAGHSRHGSARFIARGGSGRAVGTGRRHSVDARNPGDAVWNRAAGPAGAPRGRGTPGVRRHTRGVHPGPTRRRGRSNDCVEE